MQRNKGFGLIKIWEMNEAENIHSILRLKIIEKPQHAAMAPVLTVIYNLIFDVTKITCTSSAVSFASSSLLLAYSSELTLIPQKDMKHAHATINRV